MLIDIGNGVIVDAEQQLRDLDRVEYEDSLYAFLKAAWKFIDPSPWIDSWAIGAVAEHLEAVADGEIRRLMIHIPPRMGKQIADETPVLTTHGWKTHGELVVGDRVFHPSGTPVEVVAVSEKTPSNVRMEFFDGSVIYCHEEHEWTLYNRPYRRWETVEARSFLEPRRGRWGRQRRPLKGVTSAGRASHQLPLSNALILPDRDLPLHPYVLGAWLGDGSTSKPCITHAPLDSAVVDRIVALGFSPSAVWTHKTTGVLTTSFAGTPLAPALREIGVYSDKHIPEAYLLGSIQQRAELLAGLLDTDGHVDKNSRCTFSTVSRRLAEGVADLARSLGWRAGICETPPRLSSSGIQGRQTCFTVAFQPTSEIDIPTQLARKRIKRAAKPRRVGLKSVRLDPGKRAGHCVQVAASDGLYLVGRNLIPTHNSSLCSVAFPAWVWAQPVDGPTSGPSVPFLSASYDLRLSLRDNVKCRRLIQSPWYQSMWGDRFQLNDDQNAKSRFSNNRKGERLITSIGAGVTGEGANIILVDDPNSASEVSSEATIQSTIDWWDGTMSSRLNDPKTGAYVVIQQRLAENDLSGHILDREAGEWTHLCLPMRFEQDRSFVTTIGWEDPRTQEGELLCPDRFGEPEVAALERTMGPWIASGQLQQRPERKGGGIIKREWWEPWEIKEYPPFDYILASADTAFTEKQENDCSALTIWGVFTTDPMATAGRMIGPDGRPVYSGPVYTEQAPKVMLMHAWHGRLELHDLVSLIAHICGAQPPSVIDQRWDELTRDAKGRRFPRFPIDKLIIEAKASGHSVAQEIRRIYGGENFGVQLIDPGSQDKVARLYSVQHLFAEGMIYAPDRTWAEEVIAQVATFPKSKLKDLTDTVSQALRHLRDMGLLIRAPERLQEIEASKVFTGRPPAPLYPA